MDANLDKKISREEFHVGLYSAWGNMDDEQLKQGVLEVLASANDFSSLPTLEMKIRKVFKFMDADDSGFLDMDELRQLGQSVNPRVTRAEAMELLGQLDSDGDGYVDINEFVQGMTLLLQGQSDEDATQLLRELMDQHRFKYDFSRCFVGPNGILPLLSVLAQDTKCQSISLRNNGIRNAQCPGIFEALKGHENLEALDLGNNPIGDEGAVHLLNLVKINTNITEMYLDDTHITRQWYNTSATLGDREFEDARPIMEQLERNRVAKKGTLPCLENVDLDKVFSDRKDAIKELFYSLVGPEMRVSYDALVESMAAMGEEWGILPSDVLKHFRPERMFRHKEAEDLAAGRRSSHEEFPSAPSLSYSEFITALKYEGFLEQVRRVLHENLFDIKELFYKLADESGKLSYTDCTTTLWTSGSFGINVRTVGYALTTTLFFGLSTIMSDEVFVVGPDGLYESIGEGMLSWAEFYNSINESV